MHSVYDWSLGCHYGELAQLARARHLHCRGHRFDPVILHKQFLIVGEMVYTGGSGKSQVEIRCETLPLASRQTSQLV